jgi:hypothetical protein
MDQKIVDKIVKCLNMADSKDYNENEAMSALRIAQNLAREYNLDIASIEASKQKKNAEDIKYDLKEGMCVEKNTFVNYEFSLFEVCDILFGIKHYFNKRRGWMSAIFIGTVSDVSLSQRVYTLLREMARRAARDEIGSGWSNSHRSYAWGFSNRLLERARAYTEPVAKVSTCFSLVVRNKEQQVQQYLVNLGLSQLKTRRQYADSTAYHLGRAAAEGISLDFTKNLE